jgi:beta-galactosidase
MRRETVVGLIVPREYARLSRATHVLGPVSPSTLEALGGTPVDGCREDPLGFPGPIQVLWWRMLAKVSDALTRAGIPYVYVDSEAPETRLKGMRVLVTPSYEFADPQRWQHLHRAAEQGATIIYGPALPDRDPFMRHVEFTSPPNARRVLLDTPEDADRLVAELATDLELSRPFRTSPSPVDSTLHEDDRGRRVLFVMYPGRERIEAEVELPEPCILRDLMRAEQLEGEHRVRLTLEPKSCRIFEVQPRPQGRGGRGKRNSTPARARRRPS